MQICFRMFDDILFYNSSLEAYKDHLELVLQQLQQHKLYANAKKCYFGKPRQQTWINTWL